MAAPKPIFVRRAGSDGAGDAYDGQHPPSSSPAADPNPSSRSRRRHGGFSNEREQGEIRAGRLDSVGEIRVGRRTDGGRNPPSPVASNGVGDDPTGSVRSSSMVERQLRASSRVAMDGQFHPKTPSPPHIATQQPPNHRSSMTSFNGTA
ncbi:hypothetical protein ACLOJK_003689 [Asimina triloba]